MKWFTALILMMTLSFADEHAIKVVYDLTTPSLENFEQKILKGVVSNKNYYDGQFKEFHVTVVIHGKAYKFFIRDRKFKVLQKDKLLYTKQQELAKRIKTLSDTYGVEFLMCQSGAKKRGITTDMVYSFVKMIPNASIGLIDKQNEGYAYFPAH